MDCSRKEDLRWISLIRLPDFVDEDDFDWAVEEAERKKGADLSDVDFCRTERASASSACMPAATTASLRP